jgi:ankyrin repeat protein
MILSSSTILAQKSNIFLDRSFWRTNPSIKTIDTKINLGNDPSALNEHYFDAVTYAILEKVDNETIKYLINKKGNDVNKLTHDGRTYIFWLAYKNNLEMMKYLVSKGAKTDIIDSHGYSLLNFTAVTGVENTKVYDFCFKHGADLKKEKNNDGANALLLVAPLSKDYKILEYFISKGASLYNKDNNGNGIFNYTAKGGNIALMKTLIKKGVSYNELNNEGGNAIIFASIGTRSHKNKLETYTYLESLGIKPNITTKTGTTPLHSISKTVKDIEIYKYFLSKGVDINQVDKYGNSALTNAIQNNTSKITDFLIQNKSDVHVLDKKGNNIGYYLVKSYNDKKPEEFKLNLNLLIKNGFNIKENQQNGNTLFHLALDKKNINLLKEINDLGIPINTKNKDGFTVLHKAVMIAKNEAIIKYLLSIKADKNIKTDFNESVYDLANENEILKQNKIDISFLK